MTINKIENPGAVLAGYQCQQCEIDKAAKLKKAAQEPREQQIAQWFKEWGKFIHGEGVLYDVLHAVETGLHDAEVAVREHDLLHPTHNITIWQFDKDHMLTTQQVKQLKSAGIKHAEAYGARS